MKKKDTNQPRPNIKFIGKDEDTGKLDAKRQAVVIPAAPLTKINNGNQEIKLPAPEEQLAGPFYHKEASTIAQLYPHLYKLFVAKGEQS